MLQPASRPSSVVPDFYKRRSSFIGGSRKLFCSPEFAGRKIIFGFSYIQRVGRTASTGVWFPEALREELARHETVLEKLKPDWAAVRQFELLQEASNYDIYPMDVTNFKIAFEYLMKMRAGGYRVTIITLGQYDDRSSSDDLQILDKKLQETIASFVNMIYLEEQSAAMSENNSFLLQEGKWNYEEVLPHVAIAVGAGQLFKPSRSSKATSRFFELLEMLPQRHIKHDVAVGLQLPEANSRKQWIYIAPADKQLSAFQTALSDVFRGFDGISLGKLHGRVDAGNEVISTMRHMRSYGDHMRQGYEESYGAMASFARSAGRAQVLAA